MTDIAAANASFWNELCGTNAARSLGITDASPAALARFDQWYFELYPYLERHIPFAALAGQRVLDVGLGWGAGGGGKGGASAAPGVPPMMLPDRARLRPRRASSRPLPSER